MAMANRKIEIHSLIMYSYVEMCGPCNLDENVFVQILETRPFRISNGKFTLNGVEYRLRTNEGGNHLHGGVKGFDSANWAVHVDNRSNAVTFR